MPLPGAVIGRLRRRLLSWYDAHRRELPWRGRGAQRRSPHSLWRGATDPYAVWVSEVMLQQTTTAAVAPRYGEFLRRFPTVTALASASEDEVLAAWAGLGYYRRARNLWRAAKVVVATGGEMPSTPEGLRALPGVGAYTAAAVASIAFGRRSAAVDANVARVLGRVLGQDGRPLIQALAEAFVSPSRPGDHNQALMDLGATLCLPAGPLCDECPLRSACRSRLVGHVAAAPKRRRATRRFRLVAGLARRRGRLVLVQDPFLVRGHMSLPAVALQPGQDAERALRAAWPRLTGRLTKCLSLVGVLRHAVLDRRYTVELFAVVEGRETGREAAPVLADAALLTRLPHGGLLRKALAAARQKVSEEA